MKMCQRKEVDFRVKIRDNGVIFHCLDKHAQGYYLFK